MSVLIVFLLFFFQDDPFLQDVAGNFYIYKPCKYEEKWQRLETSMGELEVFTFLFQPDESLNDPNFIYLLNYMDYPEGIWISDSTNLIHDLFTESINSTLEQLGARLIYSEQISVDGFPGLLSRLEYNNGTAIVKSKMIMAGNRFYYLQVFTTISNSLNPKMDRFLNSFRLLTKN